MVRLYEKPISVNEAWKGRRYKTDIYKHFEMKLLFLLPKLELPEPPFEVHYKFGFSNERADVDNPVKPITDILQKKYNFDDKDIYKYVIEKEVVKKNLEFFEFNITHYEKT